MDDSPEQARGLLWLPWELIPSRLRFVQVHHTPGTGIPRPGSRLLDAPWAGSWKQMKLRPFPLCLTPALACPGVWLPGVFPAQWGGNVEINTKPPSEAQLGWGALDADSEIQ